MKRLPDDFWTQPARRYQARPHWELERALRRRALTRGFLVVLGAISLTIIAWAFVVLLFAS